MPTVLLNVLFHGEPVALQRHQMRGRRGFTIGKDGKKKRGREGFTPEKSRQAKEDLGWDLKAAAPHWKAPVGYKLGVQIVFAVKSSAKDGDNMEKLVFDAFNGIIWEDDSQICECAWRKRSLNLGEKRGSTHLIVYAI